MTRHQYVELDIRSLAHSRVTSNMVEEIILIDNTIPLERYNPELQNLGYYHANKNGKIETMTLA